MTSWRIIEGDCRDRMAELDAGSVQTCVTSPPYYSLRDYGTGEWEGGDAGCDHLKVGDHAAAVATSTLGGGKKTTGHIQEGFGATCGKCGATRIDKQIGLEPTPDEFVAALVGVFRGVRRVLRDDGTVWLNLGDSYAGGKAGRTDIDRPNGQGVRQQSTAKPDLYVRRDNEVPPGCKPKDLLGIPWMVAFALRADGWYLRSDIIWSKANAMPESVTDRPTKAHEYLFLLSKAPRYFYDADAIRESAQDWGSRDRSGPLYDGSVGPQNGHTGLRDLNHAETGRNKRSVWTVATQPYPGAHFATFAPKLIEPCILAGCPERACGECGAPWTRVVERTFVPQPDVAASPALMRDPAGLDDSSGWGDSPRGTTNSRTLGWEPTCVHDAPTVPGTVLDPFAGTGTTGMVALRHGRSFVGIELSPEYARLARDRIIADAPLLNSATELAA